MFNYNEFKKNLKIGQKAEREAIKRINKPVIIKHSFFKIGTYNIYIIL